MNEEELSATFLSKLASSQTNVHALAFLGATVPCHCMYTSKQADTHVASKKLQLESWVGDKR